MAYLTMSQRKYVNLQPVKLAHDQWSYEREGLSPAGAALLQAAVAWTTGAWEQASSRIGQPPP